MQAKAIPAGLCQCGCGRKTAVSRFNVRSKGWVAGVPLRYVRGHAHRKIPLHDWSGAYRETPGRLDTPCWIWAGRLDPKGYAERIWIDRRAVEAHRAFYERHVGPIPSGLELDHLCRDRSCVNPEHLEPVTHVENMRRGSNTKLSIEKVRAIRAALANGATPSDVASEFGIARSTVYGIKSGERWRDG